MTLTEFLLTRVAEDEASAQDPEWLGLAYGVDSFGRDAFSDRVLPECTAKRSILELHRADQGVCVVCQWDRDCDQPVYTHDDDPAWLFPCPTLQALALPYADHPDYEETWRP